MKAPLVITLLMLSPVTAFAEEVTDIEIPAACLPYADTTTDIEEAATWNQILSFAACVQDASLEHIDDAEQLPALIARFELALAPSMALYLAALEHGPTPVQLRAAFQIGMMQISLITRARESLVAPDDRQKNAKSAASYRKLQHQLEPLLQTPAKLAWTLFMTIDQVASEAPSTITDDVTRNMVRTSHAMAQSLRWSLDDDESDSSSERPLLADQLTGSPRAASAQTPDTHRPQ